MTSPFTALHEQLSGAVDAAFGERLKIFPAGRQDNYGQPIGDDAAAPFEVVGQFLEGEADISFLDGDRRISQFNSRAMNYSAVAWLSASSAAGSQHIRTGAVLETAFEAVPRKFKVIEALPSGARLILLLVRA